MEFGAIPGVYTTAEQRQEVINEAVEQGKVLWQAVQNGDISLARGDIPFSVRSAAFHAAMTLWQPYNPRLVERDRTLDFLTKAIGDLKGKRGIEIGPGDGFLTEVLVKSTEADVAAVDPSHMQVGYLNSTTLSWGHPYNSLVLPLPISPDSSRFNHFCQSIKASDFDYVTGIAAWHHTDFRQVLQNLAPLVKPGGVVVGADVELGSRLWRMFTKFLPQRVIGGHEGIYINRVELQTLCAGTAFEIEETESEVMPWGPFESKEDIGAFLKGLHGLDMTPAQVVRQAKRYLDITEDHGEYTLHWDRMIKFILRKIR